MRHRIAALTLGFAVLTAACTTTNGTPATAPSVPETVPTTTTTSLAVTTTIAPATTTTMDRLTEIQAIFQDLEDRRVEALWAGDRETFIALFVDTPYREESLRALDLVEPGEAPVITVEIIEVVKDDPDCLVFVEISTVAGSDEVPRESTTTLQPLTDGLTDGWGYAYVSGDAGGWLCTEPHPLSE